MTLPPALCICAARGSEARRPGEAPKTPISASRSAPAANHGSWENPALESCCTPSGCNQDMGHKSTARAGMAPPHHATGERGSRDEPGTSPFILAKLLRICQASEQFVVMTHPTVPVLHFLLLAAAIPSFLAKHRGLCAPWKGPTGNRPAGGAASPAPASPMPPAQQ